MNNTGRIQPKLNTTLKNFGLDILLLLAFVFDMNVHFTGLAIHEWLGILLGVSIIIHLLLHWKWITAIIRRYLSKLPGRERLKSILNILLFVDFVIICMTGIMISEVILKPFEFNTHQNAFWHWLHVEAADVTIFLIGLHLALNWRWVVNVIKCYLLKLFTRKRNQKPISSEGVS